jgi:hypothetical protein
MYTADHVGIRNAHQMSAIPFAHCGRRVSCGFGGYGSDRWYAVNGTDVLFAFWSGDLLRAGRCCRSRCFVLIIVDLCYCQRIAPTLSPSLYCYLPPGTVMENETYPRHRRPGAIGNNPASP